MVQLKELRDGALDTAVDGAVEGATVDEREAGLELWSFVTERLRLFYYRLIVSS
jgi:hypothetical protein